MKRFSALILAAFILLTLFAGCAKEAADLPDTSPAPDTSITPVTSPTPDADVIPAEPDQELIAAAEPLGTVLPLKESDSTFQVKAVVMGGEESAMLDAICSESEQLEAFVSSFRTPAADGKIPAVLLGLIDHGSVPEDKRNDVAAELVNNGFLKTSMTKENQAQGTVSNGSVYLYDDGDTQINYIALFSLDSSYTPESYVFALYDASCLIK